MSTYEGSSPSGDFSEALRNAVANAASDKNTNRFVWNYKSLSGDPSGFVGLYHLTVTIEVK